ncbi:hypothetical protein ACLOJK_035990 [Asimina triloba]
MKKSLIGAVGHVRMTIRKVTGAMNETQRLICPYDENTCTRSNSTSRTLQRESEIIRQLTFKNRRSVDSALRILYGTTTAIVAINLILVVAAIAVPSDIVFLVVFLRENTIIFDAVVLLLNCRPGFIVFTDDACWAFEQFKENPNNYDSMFFLPCLNATAADRIMMEIGRGIHTFILEVKVNSKIVKVDEMLGLMGELEGNPVRRFRQVCDPFSGSPSYKYDPGRCSNNTLRIGDVPTATYAGSALVLAHWLTSGLRARFWVQPLSLAGYLPPPSLKRVAQLVPSPPKTKEGEMRLLLLGLMGPTSCGILERLTCPGDDGSTGICKGGRKFLSEASFNMAQAYTRSIQGLLDVFPDLQSLAHCTSLKETFSTVLADQCGPLKTSIWTLWAFFLSLSTLMIFLELSWIFKACLRRGLLQTP